MCPSTLATCVHRHFCLHLFLLKKLFIFNMNGVLCNFPHSGVLQGKQRMKGKNIDMNEEEARVGIQHFITRAFKKIILLFNIVC